MTGSALGIVFSDMHDENLRDITADRTTASVPFGGRYRLIDFALSNMVNSGIGRIGVVTKNNYQSLMDHINSGKEWDLSHKREGLYILPPFGRSNSGIYSGRLEALNGILDFIRDAPGKYVVLTDSDVIVNSDLRVPLDFHVRNAADITVVYKKMSPCCSLKKASALTLAPDGQITEVRVDPREEGDINISLNIWIANKSFLERVVADAASRGLVSWERDVIQKGVNKYRIFGWEFDGYVGRIGSLRDYFRVSMDTLDLRVRDELFHRHGSILTKVRDDPPAKYGDNARVTDSVVADGCVIDGEVDRSVIFREVTVGKGSRVSNCVVMQGTRIGENVTLEYMIVDKDVYISDNRTMMGYESCPIYIGKKSII